MKRLFSGLLLVGIQILTLTSCSNPAGDTDSKSYSLHFLANNSEAAGTLSEKTLNANDKINLPMNPFVLAGYDFAGWALEAAGEVTYSDGALFTMPAKDTWLYAQWTVQDPEITQFKETVAKIPPIKPLIPNALAANSGRGLSPGASRGIDQVIDWDDAYRAGLPNIFQYYQDWATAIISPPDPDPNDQLNRYLLALQELIKTKNLAFNRVVEYNGPSPDGRKAITKLLINKTQDELDYQVYWTLLTFGPDDSGQNFTVYEGEFFVCMDISIDTLGNVVSDVKIEFNDGIQDDGTSYTSSLTVTPKTWSYRNFGRYEENQDVRIRAAEILSAETWEVVQRHYDKNFEVGGERVYYGQSIDTDSPLVSDQSFIRGTEESLVSSWFEKGPSKTTFYNTYYTKVADNEVAFVMGADGSADEAIEARDLPVTYLWNLKYLTPKNPAHKLVQVKATDIPNAWPDIVDYFFLMNSANATDTLDIYDADTFELSLNGNKIVYGTFPDSKFTYPDYVYPWTEDGTVTGFRFHGRKAADSVHPLTAFNFDFESAVSTLKSNTDSWVEDYYIADVGSVVTGYMESFDKTLLPVVTVTKQWLEENPYWIQ